VNGDVENHLALKLAVVKDSYPVGDAGHRQLGPRKVSKIGSGVGPVHTGRESGRTATITESESVLTRGGCRSRTGVRGSVREGRVRDERKGGMEKLSWGKTEVYVAVGHRGGSTKKGS